MQIVKTELSDVLLLVPEKHCDSRGYFFESWNQQTLSASGIDLVFVQENQALSTQAGTMRGLHFQAPPHAQDKLVRCIRGAIFDVVVDIRCGSPTYGKWAGVELSGENALQLLVPKGFLHGYITLSQEAEVLYKCTDHYAPEAEGSVHFADPDIGIDWPIGSAEPILSEKDVNAGSFKEFVSPFTLPVPPAQ